MVDDEDVDRGAGGLEFEAELFLEGFVEVGDVLADGLIARRVVHPVEGEVVKSGEAGQIDDGTRGRGKPGHGGNRGGEQSKRNGAAAKVLARGGGRHVRDDTADGGKIAEGR